MIREHHTDDLCLIKDNLSIAAINDGTVDGREPVRIYNPADKLDHAKKEIVTARMFVIPAEAIANAKS